MGPPLYSDSCFFEVVRRIAEAYFYVIRHVLFISSMWPAIGSIFGKGNWVDLKLEGDVSAAPFGDGCKKGI